MKGFAVKAQIHPEAMRRLEIPGEPRERWIKNVRWNGRAWTREEAVRVARWEASRLARDLDETAGAETAVMRDPDGEADGRLFEVVCDPEGSSPFILATFTAVEVPFALQPHGPVTHPALEGGRKE